MNFKDNWLFWLVAALGVYALVVKLGETSKYALFAQPDAYYMPPGGGTAQPGTAPQPAASQGLPQPAGPSINLIPYGAVAGPTVAARSGLGHF